MVILIHFLNGTNEDISQHYYQKEYRDDVVVEIDQKFYKVYFFTKDAIEYEMTQNGFFAFPGIIILDEINNEKICSSIKTLASIEYFEKFKGFNEIPINNRFMNKWYQNKITNFSNDKRDIIQIDSDEGFRSENINN